MPVLEIDLEHVLATDIEVESRKYGVSGGFMVVTRAISYKFPPPPPTSYEGKEAFEAKTQAILDHSKAFRRAFTDARCRFDHTNSLIRGFNKTDKDHNG